jgi:hypothetical protein
VSGERQSSEKAGKFFQEAVKVSTGDRPRDHFGAMQGRDGQMLRGDATRKLLDPLSREEEELAR